jgi:uncharacterized surface protein with fasciclin (FAS1) repeats
MMTRLLIALMLAFGMLASVALAQGPATQDTAAILAATPPADDPDDDEDADPAVVFPIEDVFSTLMRNTELMEFYSAMQAAQVDVMLDPAQEYTIFAVENDVFEEQAFDALRTQDALAFYVVPGSYSAQELFELAEAGDGTATLMTLQGLPMNIEIIEGVLYLEGVAAVTQADIPAQNGFVHIIDSVIQPAGSPAVGG